MKNLTPIDEKSLLLKLRSGDQAAFELLYRQYSVEIYRRILVMVKVADLAEEITQEVFVKVWDKRSIIEPGNNFKFFLYRISKNMVIDFYRKAARDQKLQDQIIDSSTEISNYTEESIIFNETNTLFQKALDALPPQQKQVFSMCKIQGLSYAEAGALLGIFTSTISNHIVKATKTLKQTLGEDYFFLLLFSALTMVISQF
ncbi:RNA polymerase sigma-70 factor [Pedobacter nyackensis]|uniref:RNA polymerase sigma factor n=1 Tax=Pedobacter nyackensis TaxID=475255 RepID=UPI00293176C0|nr:RNA polymerase sigma-70 factor [Pedobacter nyackensis]